MKRKARHFVPVEEAPTGQLSDWVRELIAVLLCGASLYALLCLASFHRAEFDLLPEFGNWKNLGGKVGYHLAHGCTLLFGRAAGVPFLVLLVCGVLLFVRKRIERPALKATGTLVLTAMVAVLLAGPDGLAGYSAAAPAGGGGAFGQNLSPKLQSAFGATGRLLLVLFGMLAALLVMTEWLFSSMLQRVLRGGERLGRRLLRLPVVAPAGSADLAAASLLEDRERAPARGQPRTRARPQAEDGETEDDDEADDDEDEGDLRAGAGAGDGQSRARRSRRRSAADADAEPDDDDEDIDDRDGDARKGDAAGNRPASAKAGRSVPAAAEVAAAADKPVEPPPPPPKIVLPQPRPLAKVPPKPKPKRVAQGTLPFDEKYPFPPVELFKEPLQADVGQTAQVLQKNSEAIVGKLNSFGLVAEVVGISVGPAVTQYELRLADGIRVGKIVGFEADLAAALKAVSVRVVAPIPGKDTIGIEVPNQERQRVYMRELLDQFGQAENFAIPLFLGKDVAGNPIVEDLTRMPHLLIAGTTGSGKSVCINTILLSILMTRTPAQVKLILVDPKVVELQSYKVVPHLCCDVVTNMKKAPGVLQWAVDEMENRYSLLSAAGVNHIRSYNRLGQQELNKRLKRDLEPDRVHLPYIVLVIDELADMMSVAANEIEESIQRLAQKSRAVGMHVILATQRPSTDVITGVIKANLPTQIAFKVNRKIDSRVILDSNGAEKLLGYGDMLYLPPGGGAIVRAQGTFVADDELQGVVKFLEEQGQRPNFLPDLVQSQSSSRPGMAEKDALYREAVEVILGQQRGSATLLQRALAVGYTRATRLLEMMEEDGLVGAFQGSKSREVLMTLEEWKAREAAVAAELEAQEADAEGGGAAADSGAEHGGTGDDGDRVGAGDEGGKAEAKADE